MGKPPPFKYKPAKPRAAQADVQQIQTVGSGDVVATYADVFVVAIEAGTNMATFYFYQRQLPDRPARLGTTEMHSISTAKCVSRIVLAPEAADKFLAALAENRGFTIARKPTSEEDKKE